MITRREGALYVVQQAHSRDDAQRRLKEIDPRLFLEMQIGFDGVPVWCVVVDVGSETPPITIMEWRDTETGEPIQELSSGIIDRVARMDRDGARLASRVIEANRKRIEMHRREQMEAYKQLVDDFEPSFSGRRSPAFHRGQHLRMSRDKKRAQGWRI